MSGITSAMQHHHKLCDDDFADAEDAARKGDWAACATTYGKFRTEMLAHFGVEEEVLFPAFEERTGMTGGPTQVMRSEHVQMRDLLRQMDDALAQKNAGGFRGAAEAMRELRHRPPGLRVSTIADAHHFYSRARAPLIACIDQWLTTSLPGAPPAGS